MSPLLLATFGVSAPVEEVIQSAEELVELLFTPVESPPKRVGSDE